MRLFWTLVTTFGFIFNETQAQDGVRALRHGAEILRHFDEMPRAFTLPDGVLVIIFISHDGPGVPAADGIQHVRARYSSDNGRTWGEEEVLFTLPKEHGGFGYWVGMVDREGEIQLLLLNDRETGSILPWTAEKGKPTITIRTPLDIWHVKSKKGRKQWTVPKPIWKGRAGDLQSVTQLKNGRIVLPFSYLTDRSWGNRGDGQRQFTYYGQFSCSVLYSDDDGDTWSTAPAVLETPAVDLYAYGPIEPVVIELSDGRVWMLIRTQMGRFYESFSNDGVVWSSPNPSSILSSDSPAGLVRLKDGHLLLFVNSCQRFPYAAGGRHVLHAAISKDEGKTWTGYREVLRDPEQGFGPPLSGDNGVSYPYQTLAADGSIVFSLWVDGTKAGRNLYRLEPEWLEEVVQEEHFDEGLARWTDFGTKGTGVVAHPDGGGKQVLLVRKAEQSWASGAVLNFPSATKGRLTMRLMLKPDFGGIQIGITDHYSVPFDGLATFYNLANIEIAPDLKVGDGKYPLVPLKWHVLQLDWDCTAGICLLQVDGVRMADMPLRRISDWVNYLRIGSTSNEVDDGVLVEYVKLEKLL